MPIQRYESLYCKALGKQWTDETDWLSWVCQDKFPNP